MACDNDGRFVLLGEVPVPREQHCAGSLSHSQQGRGGTVSQEGCPAFCTILLGHYQLDKLCVLWSGQDNLDKVSHRLQYHRVLSGSKDT